jgi:hypothetical protein
VPIITDEAQPHLLIEDVTGREVRSEVLAGTVTAIEVTNPSSNSRRMGLRLRNDGPDTMVSLEDPGSGVNSGSPSRRDVPCRRPRAA